VDGEVREVLAREVLAREEVPDPGASSVGPLTGEEGRQVLAQHAKPTWPQFM